METIKFSCNRKLLKMEHLMGPVCEVFSELEFEILSPPSYVKFFANTTEDVVLVYAKTKQSTTNNFGTRVSKDNRPRSDELDLTGSPLKVDLSLHTLVDDTLLLDEPQMWSKEEALHGPISVEKARKVANLFNELLQDNEKDQTIPMWIVCDPRETKQLLLTIQSYKNYFKRGIVNFDGYVSIQDVDMDVLVEKYTALASINEDLVNIEIDCKYLLSGMSYDDTKTIEELLNAPHNGSTNLLCEWTTRSLQTPIITSKVNFEQEVIVGHLGSPCQSMWKSVCALHSINQLLVDMTATGFATVDLEKIVIRKDHITSKPINSTKRLKNLLNEVEMYSYMVKRQKGGFICGSNDCTSLKQCLDDMGTKGSSNDFTYRLWDILKDCETAEELISLLIQALKVISSGKMKPFIDASNKTYLAKLVLRLSRGHSQTAKVLKNLRGNPPQAFSLVGQVGVEKTMWEYTHLMSLVEHSFFIAGIWSSEVTSEESIEQINQTIYDMTMGGEFNLNPFENKSSGETSIRIDCESFYEEDGDELTVDDFASLKTIGNDKKSSNEVPLISDEIDISGWKNLLMKFSQVHLCMEHLNRAQQSLRTDFETLKPMASRLREQYVADNSPIKSVGQLINDPVQKITVPIDNNIVKDNLKKPAFWYRVSLTTKEESTAATLNREVNVTHAFTQQPVFSPTVWQHLEQQNVEVPDNTVVGVDLKYYSTKYTLLSNQFVSIVGSR